MEPQQESSKLAATASRNFSSSSSAFFSACESPFFSPRSPQLHLSETVQLNDACSSNHATLARDTVGSVASVRRLESLANSKYMTSDISTAPSFSVAGDLEAARANDICYGNYASYSQGTSVCNPRQKESQKKSGRNCGEYSLAESSASHSSVDLIKSSDVYIGFHGRKPSLLRFANWLRAELEIQGISSFASDRARCRNSRSHHTVRRIMNSCAYGVVIITKKSFVNPYSIEELKSFLGTKNLVPIFFDLASSDCLARDIIERRGELWERYGGELWMLYGGLEKEWRDAVDGLSHFKNWHVEANDGNWRDCILKAVTLLAVRLGRWSVGKRVDWWRKNAEKVEFPFPRNEEFVGRQKELSELELILFGDVSGSGERHYFELKTRHKQKILRIGRRDSHQEDESTKDQESETSSKGKDPILWKESEKEIEMHGVGSLDRRSRSFKGKNGGRAGRRKRWTKILYGKGIACVSGDSGIGKTELALEYAYRFSQRYKMVLWVGGETRYIRQNFLNLASFLEVDLSVESHSLEKGKVKSFQDQEEEAIAKLRRELMRDIPFLVVIDNLEKEKDWWDQKFIMDLLPRFGGETHFIITTYLPRIMNLEPMKLSYLSSLETMSLLKGSVNEYPIAEIDALRVIEEKLGRLTLGLAIVRAILSQLPISPSKLLDTISRMPLKDTVWSEGEVNALQQHPFLMQLLDVCLSIFHHADGPRSLAGRMVLVSGWFAPAAIPISLLALAAHKVPGKHRGAMFRKKFASALTCRFTKSCINRSELEASSMLIRFGIARNDANPGRVHFHEITRLYARKRGFLGVAHAVFEAVCLSHSVSLCSSHSWAACFLLFSFGLDPVVKDPKPTDLLLFVRRIALPLAIQTFIKFSRCNAALELLRQCTNALDGTEEAMVTRAEKWLERSSCCARPAHPDAEYTHLWQELALLKATVLETRAKLMLKGGDYDIAEDLVRKAMFIRTTIQGEHHSETVSTREMLSKLTHLLTSKQLS